MHWRNAWDRRQIHGGHQAVGAAIPVTSWQTNKKNQTFPKNRHHKPKSSDYINRSENKATKGKYDDRIPKTSRASRASSEWISSERAILSLLACTTGLALIIPSVMAPPLRTAVPLFFPRLALFFARYLPLTTSANQMRFEIILLLENS